MEFRGVNVGTLLDTDTGRYRNRVEFRGGNIPYYAAEFLVDIGTEWNLEGIQKRYQEAKKG